MLVNMNRLNLFTTVQSSILVNMKHPKLHTVVEHIHYQVREGKRPRVDDGSGRRPIGPVVYSKLSFDKNTNQMELTADFKRSTLY